MLHDWDALALNTRAGQRHPFAQFKQLTLQGYYTSQVGMEQELRVQPGGGADDPNGPYMNFGLIGFFG